MTAESPDGLPVKRFATPAAMERWLQTGAASGGVWLQIAKKGTGVATVDYAQALDVALCNGWIDGQKRGLDDTFFLQRFTPRRPRSLWSKINIGHAERLIAAGLMRAAGQREIDAAKADGRWESAYAGSRAMSVPPELAELLAQDKQAAAFFATLDASNRYAFCWRVQTARKPETRHVRAEKFVRMLARAEKLH